MNSSSCSPGLAQNESPSVESRTAGQRGRFSSNLGLPRPQQRQPDQYPILAVIPCKRLSTSNDRAGPHRDGSRMPRGRTTDIAISGLSPSGPTQCRPIQLTFNVFDSAENRIRTLNAQKWQPGNRPKIDYLVRYHVQAYPKFSSDWGFSAESNVLCFTA